MFDGKRARLALMGLAIAIAVSGPAALGQTTVTQDNPITSTVISDCNGDTITFTGTLHSVFTFNTNPSGMVHTGFDFSVHATGVDTTPGPNYGLTYIVNDNSHAETNVRGVAQVQNFGAKMMLISQGSAPNEVDRSTMHVVIHADNSFAVQRNSETISCK